jgi:Carboxypeptidase regulatory-like domain
MSRCWSKTVLTALLCLAPALSAAQGRITGQIVGTVKDASGAVVPKADLILIDNGTGATVETKSGADGNFVFPNLQPGRYQITATFQGFQPVTIQQVVVETARSVDVVVQFQVAGVSESVDVAGRSQVVETSSSTVANTLTNAQIAKLPIAGRNVLNFALLVPGAATSSGGRDSEYNGLPGGAINITLDGVNNNSARFRSGGTSMFVFAPVRMGAIEEVTVSTSGLSADAGAEGAVQLQFVTKRGSNVFRGQVFDQISSDKLNAQGAVNKSRGTPKTKLKQHEWGANLGGPIIKNKLFFFGNYERIYQPGETTINRTVLTAEAQSGVFRYLGSDNVTRTANLLDLARNAGLPTALDPYVQRQLQTVNNTLSQGVITTGGNLVTNNFGFVIEQTPNVNYYPTARVDYQATSNLAVRGVLNLHYRDLPTSPRYPGLPQITNGFASTYYILSTGADWTLKPNLFYQMSFGGQSNYEEFRPGNTLDIYAGGLNGMRVDLPNLMDEAEIVDDQLPIPRNNPVWNVTNTLTWLKGKHTMTFGGTYRRTTMYESIGGIPPRYVIGIGTGDPAANAFTTATMPAIRDADRTNALNLYAMLVGRVSNADGQYNLNTETLAYELIPALRKEAQNVGGVYAQDQWRVSPTLTLNYGLRWEFSGAATNPSDVYSSPDPSGILGPSSAPFQPNTLNGDPNPQIFLKPKPYKGDFNNPAPNVGVAWNPSKPAGFLGKLLGQSVYRANFGINYYDEGLISFQTAAGNGPGLLQTLALPPFTPGSLNLQTPLPAFTRTPTEFTFPIPMSGFTFNRGHSTFDPDIKTPMVKNWSIGYQRELTRDSAIEIRYVGNRGSNLWRLYNLNETNIFENGFLQEFQNAQRNLAINVANGRTGFANQGLPGQVGLPIFEAAFGARGSQGAVANSSGFGNTTFITQLGQGQAGRLANTLAGTDLYLCRMVGNALPVCNTRGYNAAGVYPMNVFQANPFAAGNNVRLMTDESSSAYDALQLQFRKRYRQGLDLTAHYTYGKGRTDRYGITADNTADWNTLRDRSLNWGPTGYDLRHIFQAFGTYDLPFGRDRRFNIQSALLDQIFGGWAASGIVKWQSGRPFLLTSGRQTFNQQDAGVILKGITVEQLQKMVKVSTPPAGDSRFQAGNVLYLDPRLIGPDGRANTDFIDYPTTAGELGQYVYLYGPGLITADLGLAKTFRLGADRRFNFEALLINAFNHRNTTVGGTGGATVSIDATTFGQSTGVANVSTNGSRQVQFRVGFYF